MKDIMHPETGCLHPFVSPMSEQFSLPMSLFVIKGSENRVVSLAPLMMFGLLQPKGSTKSLEQINFSLPTHNESLLDASQSRLSSSQSSTSSPQQRGGAGGGGGSHNARSK